MRTPHVGLLPLYLALYDRAMPELRPGMEAFASIIATALTQRGLKVTATPLCRVRAEFAAGVRSLENAQVDALVTLHLSYSPSLESAEVLAQTALPLIILDTTPSFNFGPEQSPAAIMYNHGIHGVQDLCNLLRRHGKQYQVEAGHWEQSDVLDRIADWAQAASMAGAMRTGRVGRFGEPFAGMGDFAVSPAVLQTTLGVTVVACTPAVMPSYLPAADDPAVAAEIAADTRRFATGAVSVGAHSDAVRVGLALRRWITAERLTAFSINFLACDQASGLPTMPFLEIDKAMARGIGYAGEGDVLTASLVGALLSRFPQTTFTEMFCPDWAGNRIFLSHMGEANSALLAGVPRLVEMPFPWTDGRDPVCPVGCLRAGAAVLVNLAPGPAESYTFILAPVEMVEGGAVDGLDETVHGWCRPQMPIADFLAAYSRLGGTHHCGLVYGDASQTLTRFGTLMGWQVAVLA